MRNAHLRFGTLQFRKVTRDTTLDVRVGMDRLILEHGGGGSTARAHLISAFGGDQDVAAIAAAIAEEASFTVSGPELAPTRVALGNDAQVFRGSLTIAGLRRPLRHLVAASRELALTRPGADVKARRTIVCSEDPAFVLYRVAVRFGLPVLPEWASWFWGELQRRQAVRPLIGIGCHPLIVNGTKKRFLGWIGYGLKRRRIEIPPSLERAEWNTSIWFSEACADDSAPE
jgi:hypothetical protein